MKTLLRLLISALGGLWGVVGRLWLATIAFLHRESQKPRSVVIYERNERRRKHMEDVASKRRQKKWKRAALLGRAHADSTRRMWEAAGAGEDSTGRCPSDSDGES